MKPLCLAFSGTQLGLSAAQHEALSQFLTQSEPWMLEFHHGDCTGADAQAHALVRQICNDVRIVVHPPSNSAKRAWCQGGKLLPPKPYLTRNRDIVDACDMLLACPKEQEETLRSGTWATIRYARAVGKTVRILYP